MADRGFGDPTTKAAFEVVDAEERIAHVLPILDEMMTEGLVTLERVEVVAYRARHHPGEDGR